MNNDVTKTITLDNEYQNKLKTLKNFFYTPVWKSFIYNLPCNAGIRTVNEDYTITFFSSTNVILDKELPQDIDKLKDHIDYYYNLYIVRDGWRYMD